MSYSTMIMGPSGAGKTNSLRNLDTKSTFLIQVVRKPLPFKGWREKWREVDPKVPGGNMLVSDSPELIRKYMLAISLQKPEVKTIIIDDAQYVMANDFMRSVAEKGYDKFNRIGADFWNIVMDAAGLRSDLNVVILQHEEIDENGRTKAKTIGRMLDDKIVLEGLFTVVLRAAKRDGKHVFLTKNSGSDTVKAPDGMFHADMIDNDLTLVLEAINSY